MADVLEVVLVVALASGLGYAIHRFYPDSREQLGTELDDAFYRASVRAMWAAVTAGAIVVLLLWLLL